MNDRQPLMTRSLMMGRFQGVPILVSPSWWLVAAFLTVSLAPRFSARAPDLGALAYLVAFAFAVLLYLSVLIHELSHTWTALRFGLPVRRITLHLLGGVSEIGRQPETPAREIVVSGSGPVVSLGLGVLAGGFTRVLPADGAAGLLCEQLMVANLLVGVFNLLPGMPLDGGHVLRALVWQVTGDPSRGTSLAGWTGRVTAAVVVALPFGLAWWWQTQPDLVSLVWAVVVASFIWAGSSEAIAGASGEARISGLSPRTLLRSARVVPLATSLADALDGTAAPVVVVGDDGRAVGLLHPPAAQAVPQVRRPFVSVGSVSRRLDEHQVLTADLSGRALLEAMAAHPCGDYLVIDAAGRVLGVLVSSDVEAALSVR